MCADPFSHPFLVNQAGSQALNLKYQGCILADKQIAITYQENFSRQPARALIAVCKPVAACDPEDICRG